MKRLVQLPWFNDLIWPISSFRLLLFCSLFTIQIDRPQIVISYLPVSHDWLSTASPKALLLMKVLLRNSMYRVTLEQLFHVTSCSFSRFAKHRHLKYERKTTNRWEMEMLSWFCNLRLAVLPVDTNMFIWKYWIVKMGGLDSIVFHVKDWT